MASITYAPAAILAKVRQARAYLYETGLDKDVNVWMFYSTTRKRAHIKMFGKFVPSRMKELTKLGFVYSNTSPYGAIVYINEDGVMLPNPKLILERVTGKAAVRHNVASISNFPYCPHCGHIL